MSIENSTHSIPVGTYTRRISQVQSKVEDKPKTASLLKLRWVVVISQAERAKERIWISRLLLSQPALA
jgi:hypothetical protein